MTGRSDRRAVRARRAAARAGVLVAALQIGAWLLVPAQAQVSQKSGDNVRVTPDQLHQLGIVMVESYSFRAQKPAVGQIAYNEDASTVVLAPFAGRVSRLIAKVGDKVKRGDPLLEIDSPDVVQPQNELIAAVSALNKVRKQLELARIQEKRQKDLYEGKAAALKEWQQAQAQLVAAESDMAAGETALDAARSRLRILGFDADEVAASEQKGTIRRAIPIYAPIDGTVIARKVGPGQHVRSDPGDPLFAIADLSTMWLKAYVPEIDIPLVRVGQEIEIKVAALAEGVFRARITHIGAAFETATRRVVVRSEVPNPDGALKAEMFASFKIATGDGETAPAIPVQALIREGDLATVWVQREPLLFARRKVSIGREQDGRVQIRDGLKPGELVIARGAIFVDNEWRQ